MPARLKPNRIYHANFRACARQIVELLTQNFDEILLIEGASFEHSRRLAQRRSLLWLLDVFHPILTRFGEVFVWETRHGIVGTGGIIRADLTRADIWTLINFAVSWKLVAGLGATTGMRGLLRTAINHAVHHGATRIQAYIRSDNRPALRLCLAEGFQEVEERGYWLLNTSQIAQVVQRVKKPSTLTWSRQKSPVKYMLLQWLLFYLSGVHKATIYVFKDLRLLGNFEIRKPGDVGLPHRVSVEPSKNASAEDAQYLTAFALSMVSENSSTAPRVILSLARDNWFTEAQGYPAPTVKRKLLRFEVTH